MRYQIAAFSLLGMLAAASVVAHELPFPGAATEAHALYHKVARQYRLVDSIRYTLPITGERQVALYYFDPAESVLYECIIEAGKNSDDSAICGDPRQRGMPYQWAGIELDEAKKRGMTPTHRKIAETVVLATTPPFAQRTTYVMYVGERSVVKCRRTWTQYTFEHEMNGQTVYFKSEKPDDYEYSCEQRFPR
jgi:hypothetical protein